MLHIALHQAVNLSIEPEYYLHLDILTVILSVSLVLVAVIVECRRRRGYSLWPMTWKTTGAGRLLQPNPIVLFSIGSFLFLLVSIPYIWLSRGRAAEGPNIANPIAFRILVWLFLWNGAWAVAWATCLAPISLMERQKQRRFDIASHPRWINFFFISIPVSFLITLLPPTILSHRRAAKLFDIWQTLDGLLMELLKQDPNATMQTVLADAAIGPQLARYKWQARSLENVWKLSWGVWAIFIFIELVVFFSGALHHHIIIKSSMREIKKQGSVRLKSLSSAYTSLVWSTASTLFMGSLYFAVACYMALNTPRTGHRNNHLSMTLTLGAVYLYGVLGTLTNIVILIRTFQIPPGPINLNQSTVVIQSSRTFTHSESAMSLPSRLRVSRVPAPSFENSGALSVRSLSDQIDVKQESETTYEVFQKGDRVEENDENVPEEQRPAPKSWEVDEIKEGEV